MTQAESNLFRTECEALLAANDGASGQEWLDLSIRYDKLGRTDLVEFCRGQAMEAYEAEDAE
jgi:hypothetical protein